MGKDEDREERGRKNKMKKKKWEESRHIVKVFEAILTAKRQ